MSYGTADVSACHDPVQTNVLSRGGLLSLHASAVIARSKRAERRSEKTGARMVPTIRRQARCADKWRGFHSDVIAASNEGCLRTGIMGRWRPKMSAGPGVSRKRRRSQEFRTARMMVLN